MVFNMMRFVTLFGKRKGGGGGAVFEWHQDDMKVSFGQLATNTASVDKPDNLQPGDLILFLLNGQRNTITPPAGLTAIGHYGHTSLSQLPFTSAFYKVAGADEPESYSFTFGTANWQPYRIVCGRVSGANASNPIDKAVGATTGTTYLNSISLPSINVEADESLLFAIFTRNNPNAPRGENPAGMTELYQVHDSGNYDIVIICSQELVGPGSTGTRTCTISPGATDRWAAQMFNVKKG